MPDYMQPSKAIGLLSHQISRVLDPTLSGYDITGNHCGFLLFLLSRYPYIDTYQRDIEIEFNIRRSTATSVLNVMEKKGLIKRIDDENDKRMKKIFVTDKGVSLKPVAEYIIRSHEEKISAGIPKEDLALAIKVIEKMRKNLE